MSNERVVSRPLSDRAAAWQALKLGFDVVVIGGGITGAGVALDAATRGYRVALLERADYACGTSSRSTKLVHGGLRYLPQLQFRLVRESLGERENLLRLAPHLVRRVQFVLPLYRSSRRPLGLKIPPPLRSFSQLGVRLGLWGYDVLSRTEMRHRYLDAERAQQIYPWLRHQGLTGAFLYYDAQTDDVRLTHAVLTCARRHGALTLNYAHVTQIASGDHPSVRVRDALSRQTVDVSARHVINATGVWAEEVASLAGAVPFRLQRSKGTHLILEHSTLTGEAALVIPETDDGRLAFAIPWQRRIVLGTTDELYTGEANVPVSTGAEARYLLDHLNRYLDRKVEPASVIAGYAGLRPLLRRDRSNSGNRQSSASLSRSHEVIQDKGMTSILGGKLTTYRQMAEDTVDALTRSRGERRPCQTRTLALYDNRPDIEEIADGDPALSRRLVAELLVRGADVVHACRAEQCVTLRDFMMLRSHLSVLDRRHGLDCAAEVAARMALELDWSDEERNRQIAAYRAAIEREMAFLADL